MLFNSFEFFAFYSIFLVTFFALPSRFQPFTMLIGSYIFYMGWRPSYALLLALTTIVDYTTGLMMQSARTEAGRRAAMITALSINLGILGTVKYLDFMISNVIGLAGLFGHQLPDYALGIVLPVGISFYTFQSIGYTLDVYNRRIQAERSFIIYAQYVAFFPQLVAGPIERAPHMLPQFRRTRSFSFENVPGGLWYIGYGLFKKVCVADVLSPVVSGIFANPQDYSGSYNLLAGLGFIVQVYCDFSGYSDIAVGVARIMGYDLMINFRQPFYSTSITDLWRKWNISLISWFRDYLYFPLGGNRGGELKTARNIMVVWLASGLWHGAAWTYVVWGGYYGFWLLAERWVRKTIDAERWLGRRLSAILGGVWAIAIFTVGEIIFRAPTLAGAWTMLKSFGHFGPLSYGTFKILGLPSFEMLMLAVSLIMLFVVDFFLAFRPGTLAALAKWPRLPVVTGVGLAYYILLFGVFGRIEFIYFQF
ncbi:putative alginate o-acetyltransferase AlgI [Bradyrhizobium sp. ORS 278]|uniref:MBOAT family O-acyltransferase n=1 Tax=Bradyrhizobium sp. (strain ORS 278) TaxID=114615 RepID=UPI0001507C2F|nr:MBOAT family O-acyltransferase [Bradyrhizobium sp. ORS 278]CAL76050.1 putative alginate o-acetyltransferase AlgI [Bradyrhizobium sp. ORS 278]